MNSPKLSLPTDMRDEIKSFVSLTKEKCGSYAYAAGFLESLLAVVYRDLPRHAQENVVDTIRFYKTELENRNVA